MARTPTAYTATANTMRFYPCELVRKMGAIENSVELLSPNTGVPYLEANSQDFKAGDVVYLNAGAVTEVAAAATTVIAGIAKTSATNVTTGNAQIRIEPVNATDEYVMNVYDATPADADLASVALLVGTAYELMQVTVTNTDASITYCTAVNLDATTAPRVVITGIHKVPELLSSSQMIRVRVKFLPVVTGATSYQGLQFP